MLLVVRALLAPGPHATVGSPRHGRSWPAGHACPPHTGSVAFDTAGLSARFSCQNRKTRTRTLEFAYVFGYNHLYVRVPVGVGTGQPAALGDLAAKAETRSRRWGCRKLVITAAWADALDGGSSRQRGAGRTVGVDRPCQTDCSDPKGQTGTVDSSWRPSSRTGRAGSAARSQSSMSSAGQIQAELLWISSRVHQR